MSDIQIIGRLRAIGMSREADALMQLYLTLSRVLAERNGLLRRARAVCDSVPATHEDSDPVVQRHARALNDLNDYSRECSGMEADRE